MYIIFDIVIALIVVVVPLYLAQLWYRWSMLAARGSRVFLAAIMTVVWLVVVYGSFIEPRFLVIREQTVVMDSGTQSFKLVAVSDLHLGRYRFANWTSQIVARINSLEPDAVVLLGDIVDGRRGMAALAPLAELETNYGTFAVLGNTDYAIGAVEVRHAIERYNVEVLTNEWVRLGVNGPVLAGLDDIWYGQPNWNQTFADIPADASIILAVHNPDEANRAEYQGVDLMISGHTHGGQIRLPLIGSLSKLPTTLGQHYDQGLFSHGSMDMFITSGAGESGTRARLLDPPEVIRLNLRY